MSIMGISKVFNASRKPRKHCWNYYIEGLLYKLLLFNHKHCVNFLYSVAFFILYETPIDVILSIIPIKWCKDECKINKVYFHFIHCLTNILGTNSYHKINTLTSFKKLRTQRDVKLIFQ